MLQTIKIIKNRISISNINNISINVANIIMGKKNKNEMLYVISLYKINYILV